MPGWANSNKCEDVKRYALSLISNGTICTVVIAANWNSYFLMNKLRLGDKDLNYYAVKDSQRFPLSNGAGIQVALENLENWIASIPRQIRVILLTDNPGDIHFDPNDIIQRNITSGLVRINSDQQWVSDQLINIADRQHVEHVSPSKWYCSSNYCEILSGGKPIYKDVNHLTASFVRQFAVDIDDLLVCR